MMIISQLASMPEGYYIADLDFVLQHHEQIVNMLSSWQIVGFYGGKIHGDGHGGSYLDSSADPWTWVDNPEVIGEILVVRAIDPN